MKFIKVCFLICLIVGVIGCDKFQNTSNDVFTKTVTSESIPLILKTNGYVLNGAHPHFFDEVYALPSKAWVKDSLIPHYKKFATANGVAFNDLKGNDCNKQTLYVQAVASLVYGHTNSKIENSAVAVGRFSFITGGLGVHVVSIIICYDDKDGYSVVIFDPQFQQVVDLTTDKQAGLALDF
jgi:hypothetical protein